MAAGETTSGPAVAAAAAADTAADAPSGADAIMDPGQRMAAMLAEGVDLENHGAAPVGAQFEGEKKPEPAAATETTEATPAEPVQNDTVLRRGFSKLEAEKQKLFELQAEAKAAIESAKTNGEKAGAYDAFVAKLKSDPASALIELGGEALVDTVIDAIADLSKPSAEREVAKLRKELKDRQEAELKAKTEADQRDAIARWQKGITDEVIAAGEKFDLVNSLGAAAHATVIEMITQHYAATKQTLTASQAAAKLEAFYESALGKSKKFGPRGAQAAAPAAPKPAPGSAAKPAPKQTGVTTLSAVHPSEVTVTDEDLAEMEPGKRLAAVYAELGIH
jgi:hypothetical protein